MLSNLSELFIYNLLGTNSKIGKPMHLSVYNTLSTEVRDTQIVPQEGWGGEGILGCRLSMGEGFTIPCPTFMRSEKPMSKLRSMFGDFNILGTPNVSTIAHPKSSIQDIELGQIDPKADDNSKQPNSPSILTIFIQ
jgi:hypothetical protein